LAVSSLPKRLLVLLSVSLALNLFGLGVFAARHWMRPPGAARGEYGAHAFLHLSGLSNAGPAAQAVVRDHRTSIRQRMHELGDARDEVRAALQAQPFDPARFDTALAAVRKSTASMQEDMHVALSQLARAIDDEHRKHMANTLWQRPANPHGRRF
jgi:uncharacterized membrane protein